VSQGLIDRPPSSPALGPFAKGAAIGVVAGFWGGLFGVGGGILMVPAMVLLMRVTQSRAHATSIAAIIASASASLIPYAIDRQVAWYPVAFLLIGSITGAFLGARLVSRISDVWLARGFMLLVIAAAVRMGLS
jgi:uncharacterized protein